MTAMLISISLLFFITQTPAVVTSILRNSLRNQQRSVKYLMTFNVVDSVCRLLRWLNNVLNFFCYCISGTRFREELMLMLKGVKYCKCVCIRQKAISSKSQTNCINHRCVSKVRIPIKMSPYIANLFSNGKKLGGHNCPFHVISRFRYWLFFK